MTPTLLVMAHRALSIPTFASLLQSHYRISIGTGDALICRARAIEATKWLWQEPDSDVLIMTDDDFSFTKAGLDALVNTCRGVQGIVGGVTPLRTGRYTAIVPLDGSLEERWSDPQAPAERIKWIGGLVAYHRRVFEELAKILPLCHRNDAIPPFYPFFMPMVYEHPTDGPIYLSEDYACDERAAEVGIETWVEPACQVGHKGEIIVTPTSMHRVFELHQPTKEQHA